MKNEMKNTGKTTELPVSTSIRYHHDPRQRNIRLQESNGQISSGWKGLDEKLYGGLNRSEMTVFCAPTGRGKSLVLENLAVNMINQKLNVGLISLEMSKEIHAMRIDSMVTGISPKSIFSDLNAVERKVKLAAKKQGSLFIDHLPMNSSTADIQMSANMMRVALKSKGRTLDVLVVDQMDLIRPSSIKYNPYYQAAMDKYVAEELRDIATSMGLVLITASHMNRGSSTANYYSVNMITGGMGKVIAADNVIGIHMNPQSEAMKFQLMKTRTGGGIHSDIHMTFDSQTLRITDAKHNPNIVGIHKQQNIKNINNVRKQLKRGK